MDWLSVLKFNPNHDPENGQFTFADGAGPAADSAGFVGRTDRVAPPAISDRGPRSIEYGHLSSLGVQQRLTEKYPQTKFDIAHALPNAAREIAATVDTLAKQYPAQFREMRTLAIDDKSSDTFSHMHNAWAEARADGSIYLNPVFWDFQRNPALATNEWYNLKNNIKQSVDLGWQPKGTDSVGSVITHEFGHHFMNVEGRNFKKSFGLLVQELKSIEKEHDAPKNAASGFPPRLYGDYSATNGDEWFACAFAYAHGTDPSPYRKRVLDAINLYVNDYPTFVTKQRERLMTKADIGQADLDHAGRLPPQQGPKKGKKHKDKFIRQFNLLLKAAGAFSPPPTTIQKHQGHAKPGGETGVNGEFYLGGQFLPSSPTTEKGKYKFGGKGTGRRETGFGEWETPPSPDVRPVYAGIKDHIDWQHYHATQQTRYRENPQLLAYEAKLMGITPDQRKQQVQHAIDQYNQGMRWVKKAIVHSSARERPFHVLLKNQWNEDDHPRHPSGSPQGGEFAPLGDSSFRTPKDQFTGPYPSTGDWNSPESIAWREKENQWKHSMLMALTDGRISGEDARKQGFYSSGGEAYVKLPDTLYHVTTAADKVQAEGLLTRDEHRGNHGIGGGSSDTISLTDNLELAQQYHDGMVLAHQFMNDKVGIPDLIKQAQEGTGASKGEWYTDLSKTYAQESSTLNGNVLKLDDMPLRLYDALHGTMTWYVLPELLKANNPERLRRVMEMRGVKNLGNAYPVGDHFLQRKLTDAERTDQKAEFLHRWLFWREHKGGPLDPLFFTNDWEQFKKVDPNNIRLLQFKTQPGAQGYSVPAEHEYRVHSGKVLHLTKIIK